MDTYGVYSKLYTVWPLLGGKLATNQRAASFQLRIPKNNCAPDCAPIPKFEFTSSTHQPTMSKSKKGKGRTPAAATAGAKSTASASWVQASDKAGLGGITVMEAALAAMFDQLKEVEDPIFAVSLNSFFAYIHLSRICRESVETVENSINVTNLTLQRTDPDQNMAWTNLDEEGTFVVVSDEEQEQEVQVQELEELHKMQWTKKWVETVLGHEDMFTGNGHCTNIELRTSKVVNS